MVKDNTLVVLKDIVSRVHLDEDDVAEILIGSRHIHLFDEVKDFRKGSRITYELSDILMMAFIVILEKGKQSFYYMSSYVSFNRKRFEEMGLIKEGKIRCWGISETTEDYLRRADKACPVSAVQNRYSMLARDHEKLFPVLEELDVALVAFSPLGNGFLTGKYDASSKFEVGVDYRSHMPQYTEEGFKAAESLMKRLDELATEKGATKGQISLAWMICKKPYIIPIPGSRKEGRLRENIGSAEVSLSEAEITELDVLLDKLEMPVYGQKK